MKHAVTVNREAGMESIIEEDEMQPPQDKGDKSIKNAHFASNISLSKRKQGNKLAKLQDIQKPRAFLSQQVLNASPAPQQ